MNLYLRLCVSTSLSPANSVLRNRRPHMMRPTGSHSTYHALRGQTIELECIVQGLWVSSYVYVSAPINQKTWAVPFNQSYLPLIHLSPLLLPPDALFIPLSIFCCLLSTLFFAAFLFSFHVSSLFTLHVSFSLCLPSSFYVYFITQITSPHLYFPSPCSMCAFLCCIHILPIPAIPLPPLSPPLQSNSQSVVAEEGRRAVWISYRYWHVRPPPALQ